MPEPADVITLTSTRRAHTLSLGEALGRLCAPGDLIALDGELGAGKTQLVRGIAQGLGLDPTQVSSPTFVIMHVYESQEVGQAITLLHLDAYRITSPDDLDSLGFDDELRQGAVSVVEWASLIQPLFSIHAEGYLHILMQHAGDDTRRVTLTAHGSWTRRVPQLRTALLQ